MLQISLKILLAAGAVSLAGLIRHGRSVSGARGVVDGRGSTAKL